MTDLSVAIPQMEKELKDGTAKIKELQEKASKIILHDDAGCLDRKAWTDYASVKDEMSTIAFSIQDLQVEINKWKGVANGMARTAYLNQIRSGVKEIGDFIPPYVEVRG